MTFLFKNYSNRKNIKVVKTTASSSTNIYLNSSYQYATGSRISYTPLHNSEGSKVIYEFYCAYSYLDNDNNARFKLQIGDTVATLGDVVTNSDNYINSVGSNYSSGTLRVNDLITLRYLLDSWENEKVLQVDAKSTSTSYQGALNLTTRFGATGFGDLYFNPFVICYEIFEV
jgi:hypothetical protein